METEQPQWIRGATIETQHGTQLGSGFVEQGSTMPVATCDEYAVLLLLAPSWEELPDTISKWQADIQTANIETDVDWGTTRKALMEAKDPSLIDIWVGAERVLRVPFNKALLEA
jgi:hypothetical protein